MEGYRGGGMAGEVDTDMGIEKLELECKFGGFMRSIIRQFGITRHDGVQLRFMGAYQRDNTGATDAIEIVVRGRHSEIDPGTAKAGDDTEFTVKTSCSYYKLTVNGVTEIEIDLINMIEIVGDIDRLVEQRIAIGA